MKNQKPKMAKMISMRLFSVLALMLLFFSVSAQKRTEKSLERQLKFEIDDFREAIKDPDFVGVFPGENQDFTRSFTANPMAATSWGATWVGGQAYRDFIAKNAKRTVTAYVFDTGLPNHPDVNSIIIGSQNYISGETVNDGHGHSTHVSGTIAGNPAGGVISPAAGLVDAGRIKIYILKVLSNGGSGSIQGIATAAQFALADSKVRIARGEAVAWNFSLGGGTQSYAPLAALFNEAAAAGIAVICANGNSYSLGVNFPANHPTNIAVAAGKQSGTSIVRDDYSTFGPESWTIAPGSNILSCLPGGGYGAWNGTSMATPHVVSIFLVVAALNPGWTTPQIIEHMRKKMIDISPTGRDQYNGWGALLFSNLLSGTTPPPVDPPPPTPSCPAPTTSQVSAKNVSSTGAVLNCSVAAKYYQFRYKPINSTTWITTAWDGNDIAIQDLEPEMVYELQAALWCANNQKSALSPSVGFKTLKAPANPVKPFEWKSYATPPSDVLYMRWKTTGQSEMQTSKITNIRLKVYTDGFEWAQDEVMKLVYGYFTNRYFELRNTDDNETATRWAAHFLKMHLETSLKQWGMKVVIDRICSETGGGATGVRYIDVEAPVTPLTQPLEVKTITNNSNN